MAKLRGVPLFWPIFGIARRVAPVALVFAVVSVVTAVLWFIRSSAVGPQHLVFFYLLPIALVATLYGSLLATLYGIAATFCAAFFLYDPFYSFYVASPLDVKCAADLLQPLVALRQQNSAAEE